ncbi:MAG: beta-class carbonic anhydrase [Acidimicrobiia bacterium]
MFDDLLEANARYRATFRSSGQSGVAARGLAVVTCIDSRIEPLAALGLEVGEAKIVRNAGARVTPDVLRSLVLAVNLLGVDRVCLMQHTSCAVVGSSEAEIRGRVAEAAGTDVAGWDFLARTDPLDTLAVDVAAIRGCALLPADLVVGGFVLDVETGGLRQVL